MMDTQLRKRLKQINAKLTLLEIKLIKRAYPLDKQLQSELATGVDEMIDYELEATIACYGGNENDYPLCILRESFKELSVSDKKHRIGDGGNHNEFEYRENHPLKNDKHCWLFHCLYDHEHLSWEEIAGIEHFWIDIIPRYQYRIDVLQTNVKHLIYSDNYRFGIESMVRQVVPDFFDTYPLDLNKFEKLSQSLSADIANIALQPMSDAELGIFHTQRYLQSIREDQSAVESVISFSIPSFISIEMINSNLVDTARSMVAGTVHATKLAMESKWAINIGGGFHHARSDSGGGFCFFNDYAIATFHLRQIKPDIKILYVDLDAHFGDGVLSFAKDNENFNILDIYNTFTKLDYGYIIKKDAGKRFTLIGIDSYTTDPTYLNLLKEYLPKMIDAIKPDMIFYNGGSDILKGDQLGQLSISPEGLIKRDLFVFGEAKERDIPIMMCLSGGYGKENYKHVSKSLEAVIALMERE